MIRRYQWLVYLLPFAFLVGTGCQATARRSKPSVSEKVGAAKSTPKKSTPEKKERPALSNPVTDEELGVAERAIARAAQVKADRYAPEPFNQATEAFEEAHQLRSIDPAEARSLLQLVQDKADEAYRLALPRLKESSLLAMDELLENLRAKQADRYMPQAFEEVVQSRNKTVELSTEKKLADALAQYRKTQELGETLMDNLDENLLWIEALTRDVEEALLEAEEEGASTWAPREMQQASGAQKEGLDQFDNYDLVGAEQSFRKALFSARNASYLTLRSRELDATDKKMKEVQTLIETLSQKNIATETGTVVKAVPWSGEDYLKKHPLVKGAVRPRYELMEGFKLVAPSKLKGFALDLDPSKPEFVEEQKEMGPEGVEMGPEMDEDSQAFSGEEVSAMVTADDPGGILLRAQKLWMRGVDERNDGDFEVANEFFDRAALHAEVYQGLVIEKTYTVRHRKELRDCLWRIAGYKEIYGDPFMWPKIWRRNRAIIQNPDLIYPGQVLIIPPK